MVGAGLTGGSLPLQMHVWLSVKYVFFPRAFLCARSTLSL